MEKILITGSNGLLGKHLLKSLNKKNYKVVKFKRKNNLNLTDYNFCKKFLNNNRFNYIINLSAITDIDLCEKNKKFAKDINYKIVKNICTNIADYKLNTFLIQFSTDQFYSKYKKNFENVSNCKNFYTKTKLLAEKECSKVNAIVLRTNFFGKSLTKNRISFTDWIFYNLKRKKKINVADDIMFSPLSIFTICKLINKIIKHKYKGVFNIGSKNGYSKYEFAIKFAKKLDLNVNLIIRVKCKDIKFFAKRNKDMRMKTSKFEKKFIHNFKDLDFEIKKVISEYKTINV